MKKIFLGPIDLGLNDVFKQELEKRGFEVTTCAFVEHGGYGWKNDIELRINKIGLSKAVAAVWRNFWHNLDHDIYHFKFGQSLLPWNLDLPFLSLLGKKMVMHFHGSDLRDMRRFKKDKFNALMVKKLGYSWLKECYKHCRYLWVNLWTDKIVVSTPDLLEFAPEAEFIPEIAPQTRISAGKLSDVRYQLSDKKSENGQRKTQNLVIMHAPSHRGIKGTEFVVEAVEKLFEEGAEIELELVENVPADEIGNYYRRADIVVDQMLIGSYGVVAVEAMLAGKPVVCYIRKDLVKKYPEDLPVISANPDDIYDVLKVLVSHKDRLAKLGEKGQKFVNEFHNPQKIAEKWEKIYKAL